MKWTFSQRYLDFTTKPMKIEFKCEHGIGHAPYWSHDRVHGCDGCCSREDFPGRQPQTGDLAICGEGWLGLITSDQLQPVVYPDGNKTMAWVGIHLIPKGSDGELPPGAMAPLVALDLGLWSSRNPVIVGTIHEFVANLDFHLLLEERLVEGWPCKGLTT